MARDPHGQVIEYAVRDGRAFALRFRAYGRREYLTLGSSADGWTRRKAELELELENILADVRRDIWKPAAAPVRPPDDPSFHEYASRWLADRAPELRPRTVEDYTWALTRHLLPFFHRHRLSEITIAEVDRYRAHKLREGLLGPASLNKTLTRLAQILDIAIEHHPGLMSCNPARGRRRRAKPGAPDRGFLEAEQVAALLQAAGELDSVARRDRSHVGRRATLAVLALGGLRISELLDLRWRELDLPSGRLHVRAAKTAAGTRVIEMCGLLRDELLAHRTRSLATGPDDLVFALAGRPPIASNVTLHALRRTYISLLLEAGENPRVVMAQVGHTDPALTLRLYAQVMSQREGSADRLDDLVRRHDRTEMGQKRGLDTPLR
jgi:integrase